MYLIEKGLDVPREECITPAIALKAPFLDAYPHAMVPMLELDDGTQIGEALSIWTYFENLHPEPPLMGSTAMEKAMILSWERRAYDEGLIGHAEIFRNSHPNFVNRGLPGHRQPVPQIPALVERGQLRVERFHHKFNEQLADHEYIAGGRFSVADITTVCVVDFGHALDLPIPPGAPHLRRWYEQMQERNSVRASQPTHMPDGSPMPVHA
jgi:glutathione S-transferase